MLDVTKMPEAEIVETAQRVVECGMDSYKDFSEMLDSMTANTQLILMMAKDGDIEIDDVEKENLTNLIPMLQVCSKMFNNCDDFYRF